jgi:hypothetical protein
MGAGESADKMIDAVQEDGYHVGGVWQIAQVTAEEDPEVEWQKVKGSRARTVEVKSESEDFHVQFSVLPTCHCTVPVSGGGRFDALEVTDEDYDEIKENKQAMAMDKDKVQIKDLEKKIKNGKHKFIGAVDSAPRGRWRKTGKGDITVDSAAEESVCPKGWCEQYPMTRPSRWMRFINASGGAMNHYGEKVATFVAGGEGEIMSLGFQVSDVRKPLAAVWRIAERGNKVQFGPEEGDNYIMNVASGKKVMMTRKGGSYVIPAEYVVEESGPGFARQVAMP